MLLSKALRHLQTGCTSCFRITKQAVISARIRMLCLVYGGGTRPQLCHCVLSTTSPIIHQAGIHAQDAQSGAMTGTSKNRKLSKTSVYDKAAENICQSVSA